MMNQDFELEIRRQYSEIYPQLNSLSLWIENICSQLCNQDDYIYDFKIRIKKIDSLLEKINTINNNHQTKDSLNTFEEVVSEISDIVGCRIIVYIPRKILDIHNILMQLNQNEISILEVKMHFLQGLSFNFIEKIKESLEAQKIVYEERENDTGYFGVHYILSPKLNQAIYIDPDKKPFNRFELQLRTLMNHAWSEVEHKVRYKNKPNISESNNDIEYGRQLEISPIKTSFIRLSRMISNIDKELERTILSSQFASHISPDENHQSESKFVILENKIICLIRSFEEREINSEDFIYFFDNINNNYQNLIEELTQRREDIKCLGSNLLLGELLLKTNHFQESIDLYQQLLHIKKLDLKSKAKILLRISEASRGLNEDDDQDTSTKYFVELRQVLSNQSYSADPHEHDLFNAAAMYSWLAGEFDCAVELAKISCNLSEKHLTKEKSEKDKLEILKLRKKYITNYIYFCLDNFKAQDAKFNDLTKLKALINRIKPNVIEVLNLSQKLSLKFNSYEFDTLAWYFYHVAFLENSLNNIDQARSAIFDARKFNESCRRELILNEVNESTSHSLIYEHTRIIESLFTIINSNATIDNLRTPLVPGIAEEERILDKQDKPVTHLSLPSSEEDLFVDMKKFVNQSLI